MDDNLKNYIAVVQYLRRCHSTTVEEPIDPTITDTSYDPDSTVKAIKQQKSLSEAETCAVIKKYKAGASTYDLAAEFGCHRATISAMLKKNGIHVTCRKVDIPVAIKMYESGKTTTEIAKYFHTDEIIPYYLHDITDSFIERTKVNYDTLSFHDYLIILFTHLYEQREVGVLLLNAGFIHYIKDEFDRIFSSKAKSREDLYRRYFVAGGLYNLYFVWLKNGCKESPEGLSDMFMEFKIGNEQ